MQISIPPPSPVLPCPRLDEAQDALPLSNPARMALLDRLEAWIDEEERLLVEIERKIAATRGDAPARWALRTMRRA